MPHCDPVGLVHSLESFGSVDGPGVRFVVFLQGCALRCKYCHNPETWSAEGGTEWSPEKLFQHVWRYRNYWGKKGGITVSGGEPLLQIDFLIELFTKAKAQGVHTTLDTCGLPFTYDEPFFSQFNKLLAVTDLILLDIKHIDSQKHKELTMWPNESIIELAKYLSEINKPIWVRHVLIPERTDYDDFLIRLDAFLKTLKNIVKVEILPYHKMGVYKWQTLGIPYQLEGIDPPTAERVENARKLLHTEDYKGYLDL